MIATSQCTERLGYLACRYPNRIREYRLRMDITQLALARSLGVARSQVSGWERGVHQPTLAHGLALAAKLGTLREHLYWTVYRPLPEQPAVRERQEKLLAEARELSKKRPAA